MFIEFALLVGHSDVRPNAGPAVALSVNRSGLSQVNVGLCWLYHDASYPTERSPEPFAHSTCVFMSVVRSLTGTPRSRTTSLPGELPKPIANRFDPLRPVFRMFTLRSTSRDAE